MSLTTACMIAISFYMSIEETPDRSNKTRSSQTTDRSRFLMLYEKDFENLLT